MAKRFKLNIDKNSEFELDLAPLLAVMVKLVPVLLLSSAFVQMVVIETELPQIVQQAIQKQNDNQKATSITVAVTKNEGVKIIIVANGQQKIEIIGVDNNKKVDLAALHSKFVDIKKQYPEIFKIDLHPESDVAYQEIVKIMDEARKARSKENRFPIKDEKTGQTSTTDYMFPEIIFGNTMDG